MITDPDNHLDLRPADLEGLEYRAVGFGHRTGDILALGGPSESGGVSRRLRSGPSIDLQTSSDH